MADTENNEVVVPEVPPPPPPRQPTDAYSYDPVTGEFLGMVQADPDPMDPENWLMPAHATYDVPPFAMDGNVRVYRNGAWGYVHIDNPTGVPSNEPAPPSIDDVARERAARLSGGFMYDFGDARGSHHIGTTPADMEGWDEVTKLAQAYINSDEPDTAIAVKTDTGPTYVTAKEWQQVLIKAGAFRQPIFAASFLLQSMDPIPFDYRDDKYWDVPMAPVNTDNPPPVNENFPWTPPGDAPPLTPPPEEPVTP